MQVGNDSRRTPKRVIYKHTRSFYSELVAVSQSTVGKSITFAPCVCAVTAYIGERREGRVGGCHEGEVGIRGDPAHQFLLFYITRIMMPITDGKVTADGLARPNYSGENYVACTTRWTCC
jgi:hypothetical protein